MPYKFIFLAMFMLMFTINAFAETTSGCNLGIFSFLCPPQQQAEMNADLNIVIDRNPRVQAMKVYDGSGRLLQQFPVSTGRETFDIPTNFSRSASCSTTPVGSFGVQRLVELHKSNTWLVANANGQYDDGAQMPNSIFFTPGIAIHAATGEANINKLGTPASGGCVRLHPDNAKWLFNQVAGVGQNQNGQRDYDRVVPQQCRGGNSQDPTCANPAQWGVRKKADKRVQVRVEDSRTPEEKKIANDRCESQRSSFNEKKSACMMGKMNTANPTTPVTAETFTRMVGALPETTRIEYNTGCNAEIYHATQKAAAARKPQQPTQQRPAARPAAQPQQQASPTVGEPLNIRPPGAIPAARPAQQPAAPQEPVSRPAVQEPGAAAQQQQSNGLWFDFKPDQK